MDQRYVPLSFSPGAGVLNVTGPANQNIAPPGVYMLFVVNDGGVPSVATMVTVPDAGAGSLAASASAARTAAPAIAP
jgi:hypothetical protein